MEEYNKKQNVIAMSATILEMISIGFLFLEELRIIGTIIAVMGILVLIVSLFFIKQYKNLLFILTTLILFIIFIFIDQNLYF